MSRAGHRRAGRTPIGAGALALLLAAGAGAGTQTGGVVLRSRHELPRELRWARDVRWRDGSSVIVAAGPEGTWRFDPRRGPGPAIAPREGAGGLWYHEHLGVSDRLLVVGAPAQELTWRATGGTARWNRETSDVIADLDVHGDRLLVIGARRGSGGLWAPNGALAWLARPGPEGLALRPVAFLPGGPGDRTLARCGFLEISRGRFLEDGWFVVVPGVEGHVLLYRPNGSLARVWEAETLGIDWGCPPAPRHARLARDIEARAAWLAGRRIVDEILPVGRSAWLLVRRRADGLTRWRIVALGRDGSVEHLDLPLTTRSRFSRLRGDAREGRLVLLVSEGAPPGHDAPESPPVLVVGEVR